MSGNFFCDGGGGGGGGRRKKCLSRGPKKNMPKGPVFLCYATAYNQVHSLSKSQTSF